ncbi:DUF4181 domain-containing protein [Oceanobacillus sp. 1P07AA]|uniref:DUF4181 domain-containing protein n=1 Tax=Oceanobacillus sp. 1P07AA TaxID=3132293 RepID=UPI0039A5A9BF
MNNDILGNVWLDIAVFVGIILVLHFVFSKLMRRLLKVKKRKAFSYNNVNEQHKKVDKIIRMVVIILTSITLAIYYFPEIKPGFPVLLIIAMLLQLIPELYRVYMEKKYQSHLNNYKYTLAETLFWTAIIVIGILLIYLLY